MRISLLLVVVVAFNSAVSAQGTDALIRYPGVNPDGTIITFSYQGDIWTVPATGGKGTRLTVHEAYESNPLFSPDGKQIAFSGSRYGNDDIFVMPATGGTPKRLTYHSAGDNISSWYGNSIIFSTSREFRQIERPNEVYSISASGGTESRVLDAVGHDPAFSPDGRYVAIVRGDINPIFREAYRGPSNRDVWLFDTKSKTFSKISTFETNDILPRWGDNRTLYFLSTNSGRNNLYRVQIDENGKASGAAEQLTNFTDHSIRYYSISANGKSIVFERGNSISVMNTETKAIQKVNIDVNTDNRFDPVEYKNVSNGLTEYQVSPNGKNIAIVVRGEVYITEANKDNNSTVNVSEHAFRDMDIAWASDSVVFFTSDRENENFDVYMVRSSDKQQPNIFKSLKHEITRLTKTSDDESALSVSPDGKKVAFVRGRGKLIVADVDKGKLTNEKTLLDGWAAPRGLVWSPDSKWLAYSQSDLYFNEEVFIQAADNSVKPINVSMHPRGDFNPYWSADGSKLGFLSERNNLNTDVWFAWLKKEDWEKSLKEWEETSSDDKNEKPGAKKDDKKVVVQIDVDRIHDRLVQVTNVPGNEGNLVISKDGETFYYTASNSSARGRDLYSIKWNGKDLKEITKNGTNPAGLSMDRDGKYLYFLRNGAINRIDTKSDRSESLPFSARQRIDYTAERTQVFEEAWRTIRDGFYDPQFHGQDWEALRKKYRDLCVMASTNEDFGDMFNYMLGELNASHMALRAPGQAETQRDATGLLGVELVPVKGGVRITKVILNSPADKSSSKLNVGDVITQVDGESVTADGNFYEMLNGRSENRLLLNVQGADGKTREVVIRPVSNVRQLMYEEWVEDRKKFVDKLSNGRLGYIHIQGMNLPSFELFERELTAAGYGKDGLVIDVRYNGGGSTTDLLMTILNYKQHAYTIPRGASDNLERDKLKFRDYYPTGERLVYAAWMKPSIALCNEGSYSNAEIFSHAFKQLGIGKLIGQPTNGSVISTGGRALMDGSFVRLPFRGWYTKATDKNQELGPAVPDILVENDLDWIAKGTDAQLKRAVEELLKEIDSKK